jgi:hypothetical protein
MKIPFGDDRKDWVKVLEELYERMATIDKNTLNSIEDMNEHINNPHEIKEKLGLSNEEMSDATDHLYDLDLIKDPSFPMALTQEGLELAHQIKTERQRRNTNIILILLTAFLVGIEILPPIFSFLIDAYLGLL